MSEYQYYEFQAIDRALTREEMDELRSCSSRARITARKFVNDYSFGDFKGDEDEWMAQYFDAFLYLANWGSHVLKLRLPAKLLPAATANQYCIGDSTFAEEKDGKIIVTFRSEEDGGDWVEGEGWLSSLIPIRAELARGDLRALYLGWLLSLQNLELDDDAVEPPVPPNLQALSASLQSLVEFLRIDADLLDIAAEGSAKTQDESARRKNIPAWVAGLQAAAKDELLVRLAINGDAQIQNELLARYDKAHKNEKSGNVNRRTAAELLAIAEKRGNDRFKAEEVKAAENKARQEREAAIAREKRLKALAGREPKVWTEIGQLVATKAPKNYDKAVQLLVDLRDLAALKPGDRDFVLNLKNLRKTHLYKPAFIKRLRDIGM